MVAHATDTIDWFDFLFSRVKSGNSRITSDCNQCYVHQSLVNLFQNVCVVLIEGWEEREGVKFDFGGEKSMKRTR